MMTRGRGGVSVPPKNDDVICEQPLTSKLVITSAKSLICDSVFVKGLKTLSLLVGGEGSLVP